VVSAVPSFSQDEIVSMFSVGEELESKHHLAGSELMNENSYFEDVNLTKALAHAGVLKSNYTWDNQSKLSGISFVEYRAVQAHDAAMAYLPHTEKKLCRHYKTQGFRQDADFHFKHSQYPSAFSSLLDCGARSLDLRLGNCPHEKKCAKYKKGSDLTGKVYMHHSVTDLYHVTFESELGSIVRWSKEHPGELVLLKIVPDNSSDEELITNIKDALNAHKIHTIDNRSKGNKPLNGCWHGKPPWTLEKAKKKRLVAIFKYDIGSTGKTDLGISCEQDNFYPSIGYNPFLSAKSFHKLVSYAKKLVENPFPPAGPWSPEAKFEELQLLWQSAGTVPFYLFYYNILRINQKSRINEYALALAKAGFLANASLIKLNDICMHGPDIAEAIGTTVSQADRARCAVACGGMNKANYCPFFK